MSTTKTVLITGAAKRGGAAIARQVHKRGYSLVLHCRDSSFEEASTLAAELNAIRPNSALVWASDLCADMPAPPHCAQICGLVANASCYIESDLEDVGTSLTRDLDAHLAGHLALISHCKDALIAHRGAIVAITDIHVERATKGYLTYHAAKGALAAAVRSLAVDLGRFQVRVNVVAPGALEWPVNDTISQQNKDRILQTTPLGRTGSFDELAAAVAFLLFDASFTTGATLTVDGGRSVFLE